MSDINYLLRNFLEINSSEIVSDKRNRYRRFCQTVQLAHYISDETHRITAFKDLRDDMNDTSKYPDLKDFFKFALENDQLEAVIFLREEMELNIHEVKFEDGKSALHYLSVGKYNLTKNAFYFGPHHREYSKSAKSVIDYFLKNTVENYCDEHGFTYFHGACLVGDLETVQRFVSEGVDVNLKTYSSSPLHMAADRRHPEIVRILLSHGAEPNGIDPQKSTVLHGLARLRVCDCSDCTPSTDPDAAPTPVDVITDLLVAKGADIEARDVQGYTPLQWAVSRLDYDLVKALLKHGACLDTLRENIPFSISDYELFQLVHYPIVLFIPEMIQLLTSSGFRMDLITRFRFLKFWTTVRRKEIEDLSSLYGGESFHFTEIIIKKACRIGMLLLPLIFHDECGFFLKPEAVNHLRKEFKKLEREVHRNGENDENNNEKIKKKVFELTNIMVNNDISLYKICQMSYIEGYSIFKKVKNLSLPIDRIDCKITRHSVQKHIANILMRAQLELFMTDLFMSDHCNLKLPMVPCRLIAEFMSDEDLIHWWEHKTENDLIQPLLANETNENDLVLPLPAEKTNENDLKRPILANETNENDLVLPLPAKKNQTKMT